MAEVATANLELARRRQERQLKILRQVFDLLTPYKDDNADIATARNLIFGLASHEELVQAFRESWADVLAEKTHPIEDLFDDE